MSYSADEYFSLVYDSLAQSALTQLDDLTGTELEAAERPFSARPSWRACVPPCGWARLRAKRG